MSQTNSSERRQPVDAQLTLMSWVCVPLRLVLGGLFAFAAYNKLVPKGDAIVTSSGPQGFAWTIKAFKLELPDSLVLFSTFTMPWIELLAGVLLVLGVFTRASALVIGALLSVFIVLLISVLVRQLNVDCGCFGDMSPFCPKKVGWCHIAQDVGMLAAAAAIVGTKRHALAICKS
jgi:uncharacterized membrane protein YphA (DoxX/SURF4 family)